MKRFNYGLFMTVLMIVIMFATAAYCGIWQSVKDNAIESIITLIFAALSAVLGVKVSKYKSVVLDIYAAAQEFKNSKKDKSDGGKEITKAEWEAITAKLVKTIEDGVSLLPVKWIKTT